MTAAGVGSKQGQAGCNSSVQICQQTPGVLWFIDPATSFYRAVSLFNDLRKMTMPLLKFKFRLLLIFFVFHQLASLHQKQIADLAEHFFGEKVAIRWQKNDSFANFMG
jgi:hypothetical protein